MEKSQIINSVKYKFISVLVIICAFINIGCSTTYWGKPDYRTETNKTSSTKEQIFIKHHPTYTKPTVSFEIRSYYLMEETTIETRYEYIRVDKTAVHWGMTTILGFAPLIIGLLNLEQDWGKGVAIIGGFFSYYGITQIPKNSNSESEDYKTKNKKEEVVVKKIVMSSDYKSFLERIKIVHPKREVTSSPNFNKEYAINIADDLGLKEFEDTLSVRIKILTMDDKIIDDVMVYPKEFTKPYLRISKSNTKIVNEETSGIKTLGILNIGDVIPIIHIGQELFKVNYKNREGYISKDAGEIFWATSDYTR